MNFYGEYDSDKYIREKFFPDYDYKGTMIEVGAGPPVFYSMSKHFKESGWRCICVEPNPNFVKLHKEIGNEIYENACSNFEGKTSFKIVLTGWPKDTDGISYSSLDIKYNMGNYPIEEIEVEVLKLDTILKNINVETIDYLSIDVEGHEIEVMQGFSHDVYKPKIILLENYSYNQIYNNYMSNIGYELVDTLAYNYIFKRK